MKEVAVIARMGLGTSNFLHLQWCSGMSTVRICSVPLTMRFEKGVNKSSQEEMVMSRDRELSRDSWKAF